MLITRIARRAILTLTTLVGVTLISFFLIRIAPGDPARQVLPPTATAEDVERMRQTLGLNEPLWNQYWIYVSGLLRGDLGQSFLFGMDNAELIFPRLLNTVIITLLGVAIGLIVAIPLGMAAGTRRGSALDTTAVGFALLGQAMSPVWLCLLLVLIFSVWLKWLPPSGVGSFAHLILPSVCIGFTYASMVTRMTRSGMIDVLTQDYIVAARARGISRVRIYGLYALKNALLPVITVSGLQLGILIGGSVVIEQIFAYPGIGLLSIQAISSRDFQLVQSIIVVAALVMMLTSLIVDILYTFVDKRVGFN
jgi:ABC-type dipeptide/oligopeptide/nickel transport system permease component